MTRSVSTALGAALAARGRFPMALCARITRPAVGDALAFTSWDRDLSILETGGDEPSYRSYKATPGISLSQIEHNGNADVDTLSADILLDGSIVDEDELRAGKWHGATIYLFVINAEDVSQGPLEQRFGWIGNITLERGQARIEFLGLSQHFQSTIGEVVTEKCLNEFCGPINSRGQGCGLDIADFTETATVTGWDGDLLVIDSVDLTGFANNEFNGGKVRFDDQDWIDIGVLWSIQADGLLKLKLPPPFTVTPGMTFTVSRGCTKEHDFCINSRSNGPRFRGFPHLKGNDKLVQFGRRNGS